MKMEAILEKAAGMSSFTVAVAVAEDVHTIEAVEKAVSRKLAKFLLFGDEIKIKNVIKNHHPSLLQSNDIRIVNAAAPEEASLLAVKSVHQKEAHLLMKGNISTSAMLKPALNKENGLRTENILSHVAVFEVPGFPNNLIVTDAALNIAPSLNEKVQILQNSVKVAQAVGIAKPKVAVIAAVEVVNTNMQSTVDAALLTQMNRRGQIGGCTVDGPLALDNAINIQSAAHKGIKSEVAGKADILLVPAIEVGNVLYKSLMYFAEAKVGAVVAGAAAPIILTSRSDSAESKLYSLALAVCVARNNHH